MITIACYNIKGGVGKTATSVNLSYLAAASGARTLVWDLDPQAAASFYFRVKPKVKGGGRRLFGSKQPLRDIIKATDYERLDLAPADFGYRKMDFLLERQNKPGNGLRKVIKPVADDYDYLFLDCPPGLSLVSENIFAVADALLVPTIPTTLLLRTLKQLLDFLHDEQYPGLAVLPFFSMVDRRKFLHRQIVERPPKLLRDVLRNPVPYASEIEKMGVRRSPLATYTSHGAAVDAYRALWDEIRERLAAT